MNAWKARPSWPGLLLLLVALACGDDGPATFAEAVCPATLTWREAMAESVEAFARDSRSITTPSARRDRYLELYGSVTDAVSRWRDDVAAAPEPVSGDREAVLAEADSIIASLADDRAETESLPLDAFDRHAVADGDLLKEVEKATARTRALFASLGEPGIDATCGRTEVVGDPSRRL